MWRYRIDGNSWIPRWSVPPTDGLSESVRYAKPNAVCRVVISKARAISARLYSFVNCDAFADIQVGVREANRPTLAS